MLDSWREDFSFRTVYAECGMESFLALLKNGWVVKLWCPGDIKLDTDKFQSRYRWYGSTDRVSVPIHETHPEDYQWDNLQTVVAWQPIQIPQKFKWWENE